MSSGRNYLKRGSELLQQKMEQFAGLQVTYRRPNEFEFQIWSVPGRNPVEIVDSNGVVMKGQSQDFTFNVATLIEGMIRDPQRPRRGDEIEATLPTGTVVFKVSGEDFASDCFEPSDSYGIAWRVHTKADRYAA